MRSLWLFGLILVGVVSFAALADTSGSLGSQQLMEVSGRADVASRVPLFLAQAIGVSCKSEVFDVRLTNIGQLHSNR
ncbi:hypothetical protein [Pseudovibrio sp. Tun.PSC04-5.I4]|uniref:hypothetical protein n=1 Tax=Pseudovibrio sp. Tun.PSC04-5.I4 TaxID=1798213 RepID=UPI00088DC3EB|nr:hypothetical protein [Pseudovibrio sp. Tun.PSC04-5.I4]SDQ94285.1 hypothetical protein SAMN04515695_1989 [Pseudovibrio sp. Tun.PSC04-5.I4]